jgi:hypothetical protein
LPATVATDVYGLGALLYRLLAGTAPRQATPDSPVDWYRLIVDQDVVKPSLVKLSLAGDLENILLKALHREPSRRYGSVPELAADLERFLEWRPVEATPDSFAYRAARYVRRHWIPMAVAAAMTVALTSATVVSLRERQRTQQRAFETRQLAGKLIFDLHDEIANVPGATKALEKLAATVSEYLEKLSPNASSDPEVAWEVFNAFWRLSTARGGTNMSMGNTKSAVEFGRKTLQAGKRLDGRADLAPERKRRLFNGYQILSTVFHQAGQQKNEYAETVERMRALAPALGPTSQAEAHMASAYFHDQWLAVPQAAEEFRKADLKPVYREWAYASSPSRPKLRAIIDEPRPDARPSERSAGSGGESRGSSATLEVVCEVRAG